MKKKLCPRNCPTPPPLKKIMARPFEKRETARDRIFSCSTALQFTVRPFVLGFLSTVCYPAPCENFKVLFSAQNTPVSAIKWKEETPLARDSRIVPCLMALTNFLSVCPVPEVYSFLPDLHGQLISVTFFRIRPRDPKLIDPGNFFFRHS